MMGRQKTDIERLEDRQEDGRGALTRGAWFYVERVGDSFAVETSILPRSTEDLLGSLGFRYSRATGRFRAIVQGGEIALRKVGAVVLPILARELP